MRKTDWHIHTTASDGIFSAEEILHMGFRAGLTHLAISDHDTLDGWFKLFEAKRLPPMYVTPAIEFSVSLSQESGDAEEIHLLAYAFDPDSDEIREKLVRLRSEREERFFVMLKKAKQQGFCLPASELEEVMEKSPILGRPQLAKLLIKKGYFGTMSEVFDQYLGVGKPGYVPRIYCGVEEISDLIRRNSGIVVLAHPFKIRSKEIRNILLGSEWIDGIEVYYPTHNVKEKQLLHSICDASGKYATGGSDFHGTQGRMPEELGSFVPDDEGIKEFITRIEDSPYGRQVESKE